MKMLTIFSTPSSEVVQYEVGGEEHTKRVLYGFWSKDLHGEFMPVNKTGIALDYKNELYDVRLIKKGGSFYGIGALFSPNPEQFVEKLSTPIKMNIFRRKRLFI